MKRESIYDQMTPAEKEVAKVLKEFGIHWAYEQPVFVWDENARPRVWTPDFYLKNFGIYIEVCGSGRFDYSYRKQIFDKNGYKVIFLHLYKGVDLWKRHLFEYLQIFTSNRVYKPNAMLQKLK